MTDPIRVFVNAAPVTIPAGSTVLAAVRAWNAAEADAVTAGVRAVTDSRGLPIAGDAPLQAGAILRTVARRDGAADAGDAVPDAP